MRYTWIPFYKEFAEKLMDYRNDRASLLSLIYENRDLLYAKYLQKDRGQGYVPEDELAIQVSYSMVQSTDTFNREVNALKKIPNVLPCRRRFVLTNDEAGKVEDEYGTIEIVPVWRWLISFGGVS